MKQIAAGLLGVVATLAYAQDMPVPKIFKGMMGQKGQYQVEMLEGGGRAASAAPTMTICSDNLMKDSAKGPKPRADNCKYRLLKDSADEAVMEMACPERTTTTTVKRESAKSVLMTMQSSDKSGPRSMKIRYTHLGACREGQATFALDPASEQCRQLRAQAAKMDPAKQCARQKENREACEKQMREAVAQLSAMCS